jgi:AraC family transcriptional regulator, L-rhamnose operon transcriptional activator RhaR
MAPELPVLELPHHDHAARLTADDQIGSDAVVGFFLTKHMFNIMWHEHEFYEIGLVESGTGQHVTDRGSEPVGPGSVVFVPPGVGHEYRGCRGMHIYNAFFRAELDELELSWCFRDNHLRILFNPEGPAVARASRRTVVAHLDESQARLVRDAFETIRTATAGRLTRARLVAQLLIALDIIATARASEYPLDARRADAPVLVTAAVHALEADLAFPWTLSELSDRLCVGPFHLSRTFTRSLGLPPMQYLRRLRAERAGMMLATTDQSVAAIGTAVGWPEPSSFSRRFKAEMGYSPRSYRRRHVELTAAIRPAKGVRVGARLSA